MHRHLTIALLALLVAAAPAHAAVTATRPTLVTGTDGRRHLVYELISTERLSRLDVVSGNDTIATYRGEALKTITFDGFTMLDIPLRRAARVPAYVEHRVSGRRTARVRVDLLALIAWQPPVARAESRRARLLRRAVRAPPGGARAPRPPDLPAALRDRLPAPRRLDQHVHRRPREQRELLHLRVGGDRRGAGPRRGDPRRHSREHASRPAAERRVRRPPRQLRQPGPRWRAVRALRAPAARQRPRQGGRRDPRQVLGRVGNSGNSSEPHLHFHVVDAAGGPSNLVADGLPYVFDRFRLDSRVTGLEQIPTRVPARPPAERTGHAP